MPKIIAYLAFNRKSGSIESNRAKTNLINITSECGVSAIASHAPYKSGTLGELPEAKSLQLFATYIRSVFSS
jgi:hypothetical protein